MAAGHGILVDDAYAPVRTITYLCRGCRVAAILQGCAGVTASVQFPRLGAERLTTTYLPVFGITIGS